MKKITLILVFLISTLSFSQNLLLNGNLENTDPLSGGQSSGQLPASGAPWTTSQGGTHSSINLNASVAHGGSYFMNLPNDFQSFRQPFTAVTNAEYTVKLWNQFISPAGQPANTDGIYISIRQNTGGNGTQFDPVIGIYIDPSTVDANYNEFTFNFIAPQTSLLFYVSKQSRASGGPNNSARMDDFSITPKTLSVANLSKFDFTSYPNPANNFIQVSAARLINKIEIYSLLGQQVLNKTIDDNSAKINVSNLSKGVYIVKAFIASSVGSYKFIKQ